LLERDVSAIGNPRAKNAARLSHQVTAACNTGAYCGTARQANTTIPLLTRTECGAAPMDNIYFEDDPKI
jgi:hypothetical protein